MMSGQLAKRRGARVQTPRSTGEAPSGVHGDRWTARADSDDLARVYRFDLAQDSEMISPTIPI
ncbi:MAG: hypothetical protein ACJ8F0_23160, partial [Xanthobacteraceae bacterium]